MNKFLSIVVVWMLVVAPAVVDCTSNVACEQTWCGVDGKCFCVNAVECFPNTVLWCDSPTSCRCVAIDAAINLCEDSCGNTAQCVQSCTLQYVSL